MVLCLFFFKTSFIKVYNWVTLSSLYQTFLMVKLSVQDDHPVCNCNYSLMEYKSVVLFSTLLF